MSRAEDFFRGMGIKVITESRYPGFFFRYMEADDSWMAKKVQGWKESVETLLGVSRKQPQSTYAGLKKSLKQEWSFVHQVTPNIGDAFGPVEQALQDAFIPALFQGLGEGTPGI